LPENFAGFEAGWGMGLLAATAGPRSVHSGNGRPLIAPCLLLLVLVSTLLRSAKFGCKWRYINVGTFNL